MNDFDRGALVLIKLISAVIIFIGQAFIMSAHPFFVNVNSMALKIAIAQYLLLSTMIIADTLPEAILSHIGYEVKN